MISPRYGIFICNTCLWMIALSPIMAPESMQSIALGCVVASGIAFFVVTEGEPDNG